MECIACGLCTDACDNVMDKVGLPRGLIRYDTLNNLANPTPENKFKILQPRTFLYSAILIVVTSLMLRSLIMKPAFATSIIADRNPIFVTLSDGSIRNGYALKITNKTHQKKNFSLKIISPDRAILKLQQFGREISNEHLEVAAEMVGDFKVYVILPEEMIAQKSEGQKIIKLSLEDENGKQLEKIDAVFISN
jgi:polyferredoxin